MAGLLVAVLLVVLLDATVPFAADAGAATAHDASARTAPLVGPASTRGWASVDDSSSHTCGLRWDGTVWCWGYNGGGEIGDGTTVERDVPTQAGSANDWASVSTGAGSTCGLQSDHSLWCWGGNSFGQLGLGDTQNRLVPTRVPGDADWASVTAGAGFTCGLRLDASLWCWGDNSSGQLGDGTTTNQLSPEQIGPPGYQWAIIAPGEYYACGLRSNYRLYCWGDNDYGELGTGDHVEYHTPQAIDPDRTWVTVATGDWIFEAHTCAVTAGHALYCWGANDSGELGTGDTVDQLAPNRVRGSHRWTSVDAGGNYSCGSKENATLWCWGANGYGQLGIGSTLGQLRPAQVGARRVWSSVAASYGTTCGARGDRTPPGIWCWGWNQYGAVGDGTKTNRLSPIRVLVPR